MDERIIVLRRGRERCLDFDFDNGEHLIGHANVAQSVCRYRTSGLPSIADPGVRLKALGR